MNSDRIPHFFRKDLNSSDKYSPPLSALIALIFIPDSVSTEALNSLNFSKASDLLLRKYVLQ